MHMRPGGPQSLSGRYRGAGQEKKIAPTEIEPQIVQPVI
jgi:hypothetical protein